MDGIEYPQWRVVWIFEVSSSLELVFDTVISSNVMPFLHVDYTDDGY